MTEVFATVCFETCPGRQLQADSAQATVRIASVKTRVHLAVLTLGCSRRIFVAVWPFERQAQWLQSLKLAFEHFGGVTEELLIDNARPLVDRHNPRTREVTLHPTFAAFCRHRGILPRECAPYRALTEGKTSASM